MELHEEAELSMKPHVEHTSSNLQLHRRGAQRKHFSARRDCVASQVY
jgi:hypothetical protein